ncbi:MAG: methionine biosynthesis protein MetW, partial [Nitrosomonas sp. PRO5]|nr:methionine biosynthesis protein MetW [Nitrosomonas sp. PRO5]
VMNNDRKVTFLPNFFGILAFYRFSHAA